MVGDLVQRLGLVGDLNGHPRSAYISVNLRPGHRSETSSSDGSLQNMPAVSLHRGLAAEACPGQVYRPGYYLVLESLVQHYELGVVAGDFNDEVSIVLWVLLGVL